MVTLEEYYIIDALLRGLRRYNRHSVQWHGDEIRIVHMGPPGVYRHVLTIRKKDRPGELQVIYQNLVYIGHGMIFKCLCDDLRLDKVERFCVAVETIAVIVGAYSRVLARNAKPQITLLMRDRRLIRIDYDKPTNMMSYTCGPYTFKCPPYDFLRLARIFDYIPSNMQYTEELHRMCVVPDEHVTPLPFRLTTMAFNRSIICAKLLFDSTH